MNQSQSSIKKFFSSYFVVVALIGLCVVLSIASKAFFTPTNLMNILLQTSTNGVIALGMTMVIITSGIDLSVGSIVALSSMSMALTYKGLMPEGYAVWVDIIAIIVSIAVGLLCGLINGLLITKGRLAPFITTLGMMSVARGMTLTISGGKPVSRFGPVIRFLGSGRVGPIFTPVIIMIIAIIVMYYIMKYTKLGRSAYAVGGNMEATRLSGINVDRVLTWVYTISGILCGIIGVVLAGRMNSAQPTAATGYEMDAIASAVIGGTALSGGVGSIVGTVVGALLIGVLKNGLNILGVSAYLQEVVTGLVIIAAVLIDSFRRKD